MTQRDKIFDIHFVQFLLYDTFFTVCNGYVPVICGVIHQVLSGSLGLFGALSGSLGSLYSV